MYVVKVVTVNISVIGLLDLRGIAVTMLEISSNHGPLRCTHQSCTGIWLAFYYVP